MKFPSQQSGITTMGLFGITLVVLAQTGYINEWWTLGGIFFVLSGIGIESGNKDV